MFDHIEVIKFLNFGFYLLQFLILSLDDDTSNEDKSLSYDLCETCWALELHFYLRWTKNRKQKEKGQKKLSSYASWAFKLQSSSDLSRKQ
jgi:hypothetical protein